MSVNSYLENLSSKLVLKGDEKESITRSIGTLETRLAYYFSKVDVAEKFCFGSYTRGTILPRKADEHSDIDYMIVFNNSNDYKPQTFLNYLRNFTTKYYSTSDIYQSYPTVVLELNHIKFELVPAYKTGYYFEEYKIPAPSNEYEEWIKTDPNGFNSNLGTVNASNKYKIKPVIRLLKYWNTRNGHVYSSYELEKMLINNTLYSYFDVSIKDYFHSAVNSLQVSYWSPKSSQVKINKLKETVNKIINDDLNGFQSIAESDIKKFLPDI